MRRKLVLGLGLAGALSGSAVVAQAPFGGARPAAMTPARPNPAAPTGGYVPPVGGFQPAGGTAAPANGFQPAGGVPPAAPAPLDIPSALGADHPLALKAEDGAYFLCVRSYSRPARPDPADRGQGLTARQLAEGLANDIQTTHKTRVYLYEHISEERKAEAAARAAAIKRAAAFRASLDNLRKASQLQGMQFLEPENTIKYQTFRYRDQIAVLVGGFRTEDEAVKAMAVVKKWPPPADTRLMDWGAITVGDAAKPSVERAFINPYPQTMVVPNPAAPKVAVQAGGIDPFLVKLNEGRPYNLLKATKAWTIGVKAFSAPIQIQTQGEEPTLARKIGFGKGADALNAGAEQAEMMAKALREMKGPAPDYRPLNLEAFVLHTRTGSNVTVGQFDGPNDPALLDTIRTLSNLTFNMSSDGRGQQLTGQGQKLFGDRIIPVPIPR